MKKMTLALILMLALALLSSCGGNDNAQSGQADAGAKTIQKVPVHLDQTEYILSQNIFLNNQASQYVGKTMKKKGIYGKLQDAYNNVTRYYVWGYLDNTLCCDWQWEFVPEDPDKLPPPGSLITVEGTFTADNKALDNYWLTNVTVTTTEKYVGPQAELNTEAMSDTLRRVQILNILGYPDVFEGKQIFTIGRVAAVNILEDPYYDNSWQIEFSSSADVPATGTIILLKGSVAGGKIQSDTLEVTQ